MLPRLLMTVLATVWVPETQFGVLMRQPHARGSVLRERRVAGLGQGR
jgi:hypothetical protein